MAEGASTSNQAGDAGQGEFFSQELIMRLDEIEHEAKRRLVCPTEPPPKRSRSPSYYIHQIDKTVGLLPIDLFVLRIYGSTTFIATDVFGIQTISCTIPSEASFKIRNVVPNKWYRLQRYSVLNWHPPDKSSSDFMLQISLQTTISPLSDETSCPPTIFAKSTCPTLKDFAARPRSSGTVYAAIIGILAHGIQVADNIDEKQSYSIEFWPEQEEALSLIASEFYNNLHPVRAFHNLRRQSTKAFRTAPFTIVCEVPDEEARSKLKQVALALTIKPQKLVGEFAASDQPSLRALHFCCICKGQNIARRTQEFATCHTCKTERRFFSRVTLTGTLTSGKMEKTVRLSDEVADAVYALQPGEFIATFLNNRWKTQNLISSRPFGVYTLDHCNQIVAFSAVKDDDE